MQPAGRMKKWLNWGKAEMLFVEGCISNKFKLMQATLVRRLCEGSKPLLKNMDSRLRGNDRKKVNEMKHAHC